MGLGSFFDRLIGRRPEPTEPSGLVLPAVPTRADLEASLDRVDALCTDAAVPGVVSSRVRRVTRVVRDTLPKLDALGTGSEQGYSVMATATDYLPEALAGYLRLPREFADHRPIDRGKSALMLLVDQLDLLAATMDEVHDAVYRADAKALVAHGRFLADKFGHTGRGGGLDLSAPVRQEAPGAAGGPQAAVADPSRLQPPPGGKTR